MQTDMHYYGTYALARAAGLEDSAAQTIAMAAEYVDDSNKFSAILSDGGFIDAEATAHHPIDSANVIPVDQRKIWVPFHFLPGNVGDLFIERLVCVKDSDIAREMVAHHLNLVNQEYGLELIGITAHVYADTFSHYGFSGIGSNLNRVDPDSINLQVNDPVTLEYIKGKFNDFVDKYIKGGIADMVALGHGSVGTYPDRPYLSWNFNYADGRSSGVRNNQETFLEACAKLYEMFTEITKARPELFKKELRREYHDIEPHLKTILATEGSMEDRIWAWQQAVVEGVLFGNPNNKELVKYDSTNFENDKKLIATFPHTAIKSLSLYQFLNAAKIHRDYVLDTLLPKCDIPVIYRLS